MQETNNNVEYRAFYYLCFDLGNEVKKKTAKR